MEIVQEMVNSFTTFLKGAKEHGQLKEWHGIFANGTIVRVQVEEQKFIGFSSPNYDFPIHRINSEDTNQVLSEIIENNQKLYEQVIKVELKIENYKDIVNSIYNKHIQGGYPYPGGEGADRIAISLHELGLPINTALVFFPHRDSFIMNLIVPKMLAKKEELPEIYMAMAGGEARRNDYIEPRLVALVSPDLKSFIL